MTRLPFEKMIWPPATEVKVGLQKKYESAEIMVNESLNALKNVDLGRIVAEFYTVMSEKKFDFPTTFKFEQKSILDEQVKAGTKEEITFFSITKGVDKNDSLFPTRNFSKLKKQFLNSSVHQFNNPNLEENISIFYLLINYFMTNNRVQNKLSFHTIGHALEVAEATAFLVVESHNSMKVKFPGELKHWKVFMFCCALFHDAIFTRTRCDDEYNSAELFCYAFSSLNGNVNSDFAHLVRIIIIGGTLPLLLGGGNPMEELFHYCEHVGKCLPQHIFHNYTVLQAALESISYADVHRTCFKGIIQNSFGKLELQNEFLTLVKQFTKSTFPPSDTALTVAKLGHNLRIIIEGFAPQLSFVQTFMVKMINSFTSTEINFVINSTIDDLTKLIKDPVFISNNIPIVNAINAAFTVEPDKHISITIANMGMVKEQQLALAKKNVKDNTKNISAPETLKKILYISIIKLFENEILFQTSTAKTHKPTFLEDFEGRTWLDLAELYQKFLFNLEHCEKIVLFALGTARLQQSLNIDVKKLLVFLDS